MFIHREIEKKLAQSALKFPLVAITGPRQSGKTTLVKKIFNTYKYVSLEDIDNRTFAEQDPRGFLSTYPTKTILDEAQKVPHLFSYLQTAVDQKGSVGQYILTGSQNFLLQQNISQTLAGRVSLFTLLPLRIAELKKAGFTFDKVESYIYHGGYPRLYKLNISPSDWYPSYIETYIERDVRNIKQITDLSSFRIFIKLCAGRIGQIVNLSDLARDAGISHNTAKAWLSVLEASYIIFFLRPYYKNFNKRLIKAPKIYFYDTGLVCSLLGIAQEEEIETHYLKGNLFENLVVAECIKEKFHLSMFTDYYYWRDKSGNEVDLLKIRGKEVIPIEIKSGKTIVADFFTGITYWQKVSHIKKKGIIIYGGEDDQKRSAVNVKSWKSI